MQSGNVPKLLVRAGVQSSTIISCSDAVTQVLIEGKKVEREYDVQRTLRWTFAGLVLHGPYFFLGFSMIDKRLGPASSALVVAKKTAAAQFILFPPYLCLLFGLMGKLECNPNIKEKILHRVPEAFLGGCIYWPIANSLNFALVPPSFRVPYLAASAGVWNSYLSWANQRGNCIDSVGKVQPKGKSNF